MKSLSARRAWIEIIRSSAVCMNRAVALRKESVDRNSSFGRTLPLILTVALRKESVDRNTVHAEGLRFAAGRSPQGERG